MLRRHEFVQVLGVERSGVDDLTAIGVDRFEMLPLSYLDSFSPTCRNRNGLVLHRQPL